MDCGAEKQEDQPGGRNYSNWTWLRPGTGWYLGDVDKGLVSVHPPGGLRRGDKEESRMMPQFGV